MAETELNVTEGAAYLGVSRDKMWRLIKSGKLQTRRDPLDERKKLLKKSDLRKLKEASQ